MASVLKKIDWAINVMALGTLFFGTLMISAPFKMKYHGDLLNPQPDWLRYDNYRGLAQTLMELYCSTRQFSSWDSFWQGIVEKYVASNVVEHNIDKLVVLTSFILFTPDACPYWKANCSIFVFLSMASTFSILVQHTDTMQRTRNYNVLTCNSNSYHFQRLRSWSYVLIISSYIVLSLCITQLVAIAVKWILELTTKFEHLIIANHARQTGTQQSNNPGQTTQQSSTPRASSPEHHEPPSYISMRVLQPFPYQRSLDSSCPYHSHQPPHCHQCENEAWYSSMPRAPSRRCHKIMPY